MSLLDFTPPFAELKNHVLFSPHWLEETEASNLFEYLLQQNWKNERITLFGKSICVPRKVFWMGDSDASYTYSNTTHQPSPWDSRLLKIKNRLKSDYNLHFNSVLGNLYRDGKDYMGWHQDNEPELGSQPIIFSLSLGEERRFCLKHIATNKKYEINLTPGSALIMRGNTQQYYKHSLPKSLRVHKPRINLTFRLIIIDT